MARPIPHSGMTLGYRIEAEGRSVAYMSDHQAPLDRRTIPDAVLELCQGVDLLVHDGQYTDDEFSAKADWGHSTAAFAVHVAAEAGVKRLLLTHHDPSHTDREIDRILNQARRLPEAKQVEDVSSAHESPDDRPRQGVARRRVGPRPGPVPRGARSLRHRHHHRDRARGGRAGRLLLPVVRRAVARPAHGDPGAGPELHQLAAHRPGRVRSA